MYSQRKKAESEAPIFLWDFTFRDAYDLRYIMGARLNDFNTSACNPLLQVEFICAMVKTWYMWYCSMVTCSRMGMIFFVGIQIPYIHGLMTDPLYKMGPLR